MSCKIWEASPGTCLKDYKNPAVSFVEFSPNGKFLFDSTLKLWNYPTGKFLKIYSGHTNNRVYCITSTFYVTNEKYIVIRVGRQVCLLVGSPAKNCGSEIKGHTGSVISVTCHPTENKIASA